MTKILDLDKFIQNIKLENFDNTLKGLLEKDTKEFETKDIKLLEELGNQIWKIYVELDSLKYKYSNDAEIRIRSLDLLETYSNINEKLAEILMNTKPKNEKHHYSLKIGAAQKYLIALQNKFDILHKKNIENNLLMDNIGRVVSETESPYYHIKELFNKVKIIYDEVSIWFLLKNDFKNAHNYYYLLGDVILKEIYYGLQINDNLLYNDSDYSFLYYTAGLAFLRGYNTMKDKFITITYASPITPYFKSNISDLFDDENEVISINELAIKCFERANILFRKTGKKFYYLKTKDLLRDLKSELNDFEQNLLDLYKNISKQFTARQNIITKSIKNPKKIKEEDVRDYFLSHINIIIKELAFAESIRGSGFSDLLIIGRDYRQNVINAITEFKVWGRNDYLNVVEQLKSYLSDFETFGIIFMINPNKSSIKNKYLNNIIKKDPLFIQDSLDEPYNETNFTNFKSEHYLDDTKTRKIRIYHFILNIHNLFQEG